MKINPTPNTSSKVRLSSSSTIQSPKMGGSINESLLETRLSEAIESFHQLSKGSNRLECQSQQVIGLPDLAVSVVNQAEKKTHSLAFMRPLNAKGEYWLQRGCVTKPKGFPKSSLEGALAGLVPVAPVHSKAGNGGETKILKHLQEVKYALEVEGAVAMDPVLPKDFVDGLTAVDSTAANRTIEVKLRGAGLGTRFLISQLQNDASKEQRWICYKLVANNFFDQNGQVSYTPQHLTDHKTFVSFDQCHKYLKGMYSGRLGKLCFSQKSVGDEDDRWEVSQVLGRKLEQEDGQVRMSMYTSDIDLMTIGILTEELDKSNADAEALSLGSRFDLKGELESLSRENLNQLARSWVQIKVAGEDAVFHELAHEDLEEKSDLKRTRTERRLLSMKSGITTPSDHGAQGSSSFSFTPSVKQVRLENRPVFQLSFGSEGGDLTLLDEEQSDHLDFCPIRSITEQELSLIKRSDLIKAIRTVWDQLEDPFGGNWTSRIIELGREINSGAQATGQLQDLVHHNSEHLNPYSQQQDPANYPVRMVFGSQSIEIDSEKTLGEFAACCHKHGITIGLNPLWEKAHESYTSKMKQLRRADLIALESLMSKKALIQEANASVMQENQSGYRNSKNLPLASRRKQ